MSTRATYTIIDKKRGKVERAHYYIHYDGYPDGAAEYFKKFAEYKNKRGGAICQFLRAVDLAEFTDDPDLHGDTEFHYEINAVDMSLKAYSMEWDSPKRTLFFFGGMEEFLNKYLHFDKENCPFGTKKPVWLSFRNEIMTESELERRYQQEIERNWSYLYKGHVGNASFKLAYRMLTALKPGACVPKEIETAAELLAKAYNWDSPEEYIEKIIKG